jgi:hypothetical protein
MSNFATTLESGGLQRNARWALTLLQDDVLQAGYLMPPRIVTDLIGGTQPPFKIETLNLAPPMSYIKADGTTQTIGNPDELQIVMDVPLSVGATLGADTVLNTNALTVKFAYGSGDVQANDLLFIKDSAWELFRVSGQPDSDGNVALSQAAALLDQYGNDTPTQSMVSPQIMKPHFKGADLGFVRPLQVVSYTIQPVALDPANKDATVPCLVRRTRSLSGAFGPPVVLVEGATQFNLDWSLDGGVTWIRKSGGLTTSQWGDIQTATSSAFTAIAANSPLAASLPGGMGSVSDPFWFNYVPVLLKIDITTQTLLKRTEYAKAANQAEYRTRRETILISSRNFALGAP